MKQKKEKCPYCQGYGLLQGIPMELCPYCHNNYNMNKTITFVIKGGQYGKAKIHQVICMSDESEWSNDYDNFEDFVNATIATYIEMYKRAGADCLVFEDSEFGDFIREYKGNY